MSYGSLMNQSIADSNFEYATIRVTGPSHGTSVTMTFSGGGTQNLTEVSNGVWEGRADSKGTYTISAGSLYTTSSVSVSVPKVYSVSLSVAVDSTLNNNNWSTISNISKQGLASQYWSVGDKKSVKISGHVEDTYINGTWYAFIIGFNHDTPNSITFQIGEDSTSDKKIAFCARNYADGGLTSGFIMKNSYSNEGGWALSYMRTHVLYSFLQAIESSLYNVLLATSRYTDNEGTTSVPNSASSVSVTTEKMFLLSAYEVTKDTTVSNPNEGAKQKQYSYYASGNPVTKYNHSNLSNVIVWWLRSPYVKYTDITGNFCNLNYTNVSHNDANQSFGIAPCFCV